jgi:double-GTPase-like protein
VDLAAKVIAHSLPSGQLPDVETDMDGERFVILIGGPDAGKTNFLIRLWMAIQSGNGQLASDKLPDDLQYLNDGAQELRSGNFVGRTGRDVRANVQIPIRVKKDGSTATLAIPDVPGEQWMRIYAKREWTNDWEELITKTSGCLLFLRPSSDQLVVPLDWIRAAELGLTGSAQAMTPEDLAKVPTQVVLVDWMQCLQRAYTDRVGGGFRPRIGVIVSAWDQVPADQQSLGPTRWITDNLPMLGHFLKSNQDRIDSRVFGFSVVGGDLKNEPGFKDQYLRSDISQAGYVVVESSVGIRRNSDLAIPLTWALGIE